VEGIHVPERLADDLRARARVASANNGSLDLMFASREVANRAVDLLRSNGCEIETVLRSRSTLEEIFMKAVEEK
jgi:hypothetical protein